MAQFYRRAIHCCSLWLLVVLAAFAFSGEASNAQTTKPAAKKPPKPDLVTNKHLEKLSATELKKLRYMLAYNRAQRTAIQICYKKFATSRAAVDKKRAADSGAVLSAKEQGINSIMGSKQMWAWVIACAKPMYAALIAGIPHPQPEYTQKELDKIDTATGGTSAFGYITITPLVKTGVRWIDALHLEEYRLTHSHEEHHAAERMKTAKVFKLKPDLVRRWGVFIETKFRAFLKKNGFSHAPTVLIAAAVLEGKKFNLFNVTDRNQRFEIQQILRLPASTFTAAERELFAWYRKNAAVVENFRHQNIDPAAMAENEAIDYADDIKLYDARLKLIGDLITKATAAEKKKKATKKSAGAAGGDRRQGAVPNRRSKSAARQARINRARAARARRAAQARAARARRARGAARTRTTRKPPARKRSNISTDVESCFTAGTLVRMADGSAKPIEQIRVGDRVLGQGGIINTVTGIERPRLGTRPVYGFNGARAFVTVEHPFMTAAGWKSIDPRATASENPTLRVGTLRVGDRVAVLRSDGVTAATTKATWRAMRLRFVQLHAMTPVALPASTTVYNLLLDGNHTYFANGFLVHNKG